MDIQELLQEKREEILAIAAQHGAYNVRVFGSVARGEAKEASDVDFLVNIGQVHSSWFPVGLKLDLQDLGSSNEITFRSAPQIPQFWGTSEPFKVPQNWGI